MNDASLVSCRESAGDLHGELDGFARGKRAAIHPLAERVSFEKLRHDEREALVHTRVVNGDDVRMVQAGGCTRFAFEPALAIGVTRRRVRRAL